MESVEWGHGTCFLIPIPYFTSSITFFASFSALKTRSILSTWALFSEREASHQELFRLKPSLNRRILSEGLEQFTSFFLTLFYLCHQPSHPLGLDRIRPISARFEI